jgi:hypothetical protein
LNLSGEDNSLYYFDQREGSLVTYDKNGKSIQKALMKTPSMVQDYPHPLE